MLSLIVGIVFTLLILVLSLYTISKGYAFKHTVDPIDDDAEGIDKLTRKKDIG